MNEWMRKFNCIFVLQCHEDCMLQENATQLVNYMLGVYNKTEVFQTLLKIAVNQCKSLSASST